MNPRSSGRMRLTCTRCEYIWIQRGPAPASCPLCHTTNWCEGSSVRHVCNMCGHIWHNRVQSPRRCPRCCSELWNTPCRHLQCKRCGYRWVSRKNDSGKTSICPRCKSRHWETLPGITTCAICGKLFASSRPNVEKCGDCSGRGVSFQLRCEACGREWKSPHRRSVCPGCNEPTRNQEGYETTLWSENGRDIRVSVGRKRSTVYLFENNIPVTSVDLPDAIDAIDVTYNDLFSAKDERKMRRLADRLYDQRDAYVDKIGYIMELDQVDEFAATVLALQINGMDPKHTALKLNVGEDEVKDAICRIVSARRIARAADDPALSPDPFPLIGEQADPNQDQER